MLGLIGCSIDGSGQSAGFEISDYDVEVAPIQGDSGVIGRSFTITGVGEVHGNDATSFAEAVLRLQAVQSVSGRDFVVTGLEGKVETRLLAAWCVKGGPIIKIKIERGDGGEALRRPVSFTVTGEAAGNAGESTGSGDDGSGGNGGDGSGSGGGGDQPIQAWKQKVTEGPDGRVHITRTGEVMRKGGVEADLLALVNKFYTDYDGWVLTWSQEMEWGGERATFTLDAQETSGNFPIGGPAGGVAQAVDGEGTHHAEVDEQGRRVITWEFDLLVQGDPQTLETMIRTQIVGAGLYKVSVAITMYQGKRLRATYTKLFSDDGTGLIGWTSSFRFQPVDDVYEEITFPGLDSVLVMRPRTVGRLTYSGSAIGVGDYIKEPTAFWNLLEPPEVTFTHMDIEQRQTSWSYVMAVPSDSTDTKGGKKPSDLARPAKVATY